MDMIGDELGFDPVAKALTRHALALVEGDRVSPRLFVEGNTAMYEVTVVPSGDPAYMAMLDLVARISAFDSPSQAMLVATVEVMPRLGEREGDSGPVVAVIRFSRSEPTMMAWKVTDGQEGIDVSLLGSWKLDPATQILSPEVLEVIRSMPGLVSPNGPSRN